MLTNDTGNRHTAFVLLVHDLRADRLVIDGIV